MSLKMRIEGIMNRNYAEMPNGYLETIQRGIAGVRRFENGISRGTGSREERIERLRNEIETADAIVIGAGAGLSTAAGMTYNGERFRKYFYDFEDKYGFHDMYSGGFFVMDLDPKIAWAFWARNIYINRYMDAPIPVYRDLLQIVKDRDYFVITTNVDHQFQKAGFDKKRLFYTQGDYGLFQSTDPSDRKTYDNEEWVNQALKAEGFVKDQNGIYQIPEDGRLLMELPEGLIPRNQENGTDLTMNLRSDDSFVEDEGWKKASAAYSDFLRRHRDLHVLYLEIGVGNNTPVIIKYPFWQIVNDHKNSVYACLNYNEAYCPRQIEGRSVCIDGDTANVLNDLK